MEKSMENGPINIHRKMERRPRSIISDPFPYFSAYKLVLT